MTQEVLKFEEITKIYGKTKVLNNISFDLKLGEVHCLVGENGAGKSTLIKILSGVVSPDSGAIYCFGKKYERMHPKTSLDLGISTIYQDDDLISTLTVADNIFLGREIVNSMGTIDVVEQNKQAVIFMKQFNISLNPATLVETLSIGQRQLLQIIRALHRQVKILVMDEPTTSLGEEETSYLLQFVEQLAKEGITIIYISHYFDEIFRIGNRATVIKDGEKIGTYNLKDISTDDLIQHMVGRETSAYFRKEKVPIGSSRLSVKNISRGTIVKDVSFDIQSGEIFGIGGLIGAGRTELVRILAGVDKASGGTVCWDGQELSISSPAKAIASGICMISEDRKELGMFEIRSILENITIINNESNFFLSSDRDIKNTKKMIDSLSIKIPGIYNNISELSGGNQQKCVIARNLLIYSKVIIFY